METARVLREAVDRSQQAAQGDGAQAPEETAQDPDPTEALSISGATGGDPLAQVGSWRHGDGTAVGPLLDGEPPATVSYRSTRRRRVEQLAARRAHNPEVAGSNPAPAIPHRGSVGPDATTGLRHGRFSTSRQSPVGGGRASKPAGKQSGGSRSPADNQNTAGNQRLPAIKAQ